MYYIALTQEAEQKGVGFFVVCLLVCFWVFAGGRGLHIDDSTAINVGKRQRRMNNHHALDSRQH